MNQSFAVTPPCGYSHNKRLQLHQKNPYPLQPCGLCQKVCGKTSTVQPKIAKTKNFVPQMFCTMRYVMEWHKAIHVNTATEHKNKGSDTCQYILTFTKNDLI